MASYRIKSNLFATSGDLFQFATKGEKAITPGLSPNVATRPAVRRPVHLVLHRGEELLRQFRVRRVVHAFGSNYPEIPDSCLPAQLAALRKCLPLVSKLRNGEKPAIRLYPHC